MYSLLTVQAVSSLLQSATRAVDITYVVSMARTFLCVCVFSLTLFTDFKMNYLGKLVSSITMIHIYTYKIWFINMML
jgi:hypothetical protein